MRTQFWLLLLAEFLKIHCALLVVRFECIFCLLCCSCCVLCIVKIDLSIVSLCLGCVNQEMVQVRSGVSTRKVADSLGMSQPSVAHLRREISGEIKKQRGGRPKVLREQEKRLGVHLVTIGRPKMASVAAKQL